MTRFEIEPEESEVEELKKEEQEVTRKEEPSEDIQTKPIKPVRVHAFDARQKRIRGIITLPENLHTQLENEAFERKMSRAAIIREALTEHFLNKNPKQPSKEDEEHQEDEEHEEGQDYENEQKLNALLEECTTYFGGFDIEGEEGFLAGVKEAELKGDFWTEERIKAVAQKLKSGYDGYWSAPDPEELVNRASKAMKLDKSQKKVLAKKFYALCESDSW